MPKFFDVTLVGIYGGQNHNGDPHEISGRLYVKTLNRDHIEFTSHDMFVSDTPVIINVDNMFSINKQISESMASWNPDMDTFGEYLAIGGTLLGGTLSGKPRYQIIHTFYIAGVPEDPTVSHPIQPIRTYWVYFTNEDVSQWLAAQFDVRFVSYA
ncbi:hypothetical protein [Bacillus cereus]|uniref:hypothetical protein n=1 Tax=Bacillus cereus TaxID=1396 RepID=UPI000BF99E40|nr:hypothetical protein [Bacillus cereus]PFC72631.1 hypothetical protein CN298_30245 [Bacillus cereus]